MPIQRQNYDYLDQPSQDIGEGLGTLGALGKMLIQKKKADETERALQNVLRPQTSATFQFSDRNGGYPREVSLSGDAINRALADRVPVSSQGPLGTYDLSHYDPQAQQVVENPNFNSLAGTSPSKLTQEETPQTLEGVLSHPDFAKASEAERFPETLKALELGPMLQERLAAARARGERGGRTDAQEEQARAAAALNEMIVTMGSKMTPSEQKKFMDRMRGNAIAHASGGLLGVDRAGNINPYAR